MLLVECFSKRTSDVFDVFLDIFLYDGNSNIPLRRRSMLGVDFRRCLSVRTVPSCHHVQAITPVGNPASPPISHKYLGIRNVLSVLANPWAIVYSLIHKTPMFHFYIRTLVGWPGSLVVWEGTSCRMDEQ